MSRDMTSTVFDVAGLAAISTVGFVIACGSAYSSPGVSTIVLSCGYLQRAHEDSLLRVLTEAGIPAPSYPAIMRQLPVYATQQWRDGLV